MNYLSPLKPSDLEKELWTTSNLAELLASFSLFLLLLEDYLVHHRGYNGVVICWQRQPMDWTGW